MNENIHLFLKKLGEDADLQEKFKAVASPDEAYAVASAAQGGFTKDEFIETMQKFKEIIDSGEVTDGDLAQAAGGDVSNEALVGLGLGAAAGIGLGVASFFAAS